MSTIAFVSQPGLKIIQKFSAFYSLNLWVRRKRKTKHEGNLLNDHLGWFRNLCEVKQHKYWHKASHKSRIANFEHQCGNKTQSTGTNQVDVLNWLVSIHCSLPVSHHFQLLSCFQTKELRILVNPKKRHSFVLSSKSQLSSYSNTTTSMS